MTGKRKSGIWTADGCSLIWAMFACISGCFLFFFVIFGHCDCSRENSTFFLWTSCDLCDWETCNWRKKQCSDCGWLWTCFQMVFCVLTCIFGHLSCLVIVTVPVGVECFFCESVVTFEVTKDDRKRRSGIWTADGC